MRTELSPSNPFGATRYGFLWETLAQREPGRHLDYGAYDGAVAARLAETGVAREVVAVDANAAVVERHAPSMPANVSLRHVRPREPLPFPDASFDSASLLDVLEHVLDQRALLHELGRVLRPGGVLVVTVPQRHALSFLDTGNFKFAFPAAHRLLYTRFRGAEEYHRRYVACESGLFGDIEVGKPGHEHFTPEGLSGLLAECGFTTVTTDGAGLLSRAIVPVRFLSRGAVRRASERLIEVDARRFSSTHLFCAAERRPS